jgi:hypothetical protein
MGGYSYNSQDTEANQKTKETGLGSQEQRHKVAFTTQAKIRLKEMEERNFIHRYDLRVETKKTDTEAECENLIIK